MIIFTSTQAFIGVARLPKTPNTLPPKDVVQKLLKDAQVSDLMDGMPTGFAEILSGSCFCERGARRTNKQGMRMYDNFMPNECKTFFHSKRKLFFGS